MNRKTSHGSRTSFGSLIEGLKPDKVNSRRKYQSHYQRSPQSQYMADIYTGMTHDAVFLVIDSAGNRKARTLRMERARSAKRDKRNADDDTAAVDMWRNERIPQQLFARHHEYPAAIRTGAQRDSGWRVAGFSPEKSDISKANYK
jgi:hypothetical protein